MINLNLAERLRSIIDYIIDIESITPSLKKISLQQKCKQFKADLLILENMLLKRNNPIIEQQIKLHWSDLRKNMEIYFQSVKTEYSELQYFVESLERRINACFNNEELAIEELQDIFIMKTIDIFLENLSFQIKNLNITKIPSCFISYSWGNIFYEKRVNHLALQLKKMGIIILLDIWSEPNSSVAKHSEKLMQTDFVLIIGTLLLKQKWEDAANHNFLICKEMKLIQNRINEKGEQGIVKIILEAENREVFPDFLEPYRCDEMDFSLTTKYPNNLFNLIKVIYKDNQIILDLIAETQVKLINEIFKVRELNLDALKAKNNSNLELKLYSLEDNNRAVYSFKPYLERLMEFKKVIEEVKQVLAKENQDCYVSCYNFLNGISKKLNDFNFRIQGINLNSSKFLDAKIYQFWQEIEHSILDKINEFGLLVNHQNESDGVNIQFILEKILIVIHHEFSRTISPVEAKKLKITKELFEVALKDICEKVIIKNITCFICYAWGVIEHENLVGRIAEDLKLAGIEILLDRLCNGPGQFINYFTEEIEKVNYVLLIGSKHLFAKYSSGKALHEELKTNRKNSTELVWQDKGAKQAGHILAKEIMQVSTKATQQLGSIIPILLDGNLIDCLPNEFRNIVPVHFTRFREQSEYAKGIFSILKTLMPNEADLKIIQQAEQDFFNKLNDESKLSTKTIEANNSHLESLNPKARL